MAGPDDIKKGGPQGTEGPVDPHADTLEMAAVRGEIDAEIAREEGEPNTITREPETGRQGEFTNLIRGQEVPQEQMSEIMRALSETLTPDTLTDVPGAPILHLLSAEPGSFWPLPAEWQVIYIAIEDEKVLRNIYSHVEGANGMVISLPFNGTKRSEALAVFPDRHQAESALYGLKTVYQSNMTAGIQERGEEEVMEFMEGDPGSKRVVRKPRVYGGIIHGTTCFIGDGICEALKENAQIHRPVKKSRTHLNVQGSLSQRIGEQLLQSILQIPQSLTRVGAVMEIHIKDMTPDDKKRRLVQRILEMIDRKTDVFQWLGNKITIVSTRERAAAMLCDQMKEILTDFPDQNLQVRVSEGTFEVENIKTSERPPRTLRGKMFDEIRAMDVPEGARGIFVPPKEIERIDSPRGLKVNVAVRVGKNAIQLVDFEERTTEIFTGGPRRMVGRNAEFEEFMKRAARVTKSGKSQIMALSGEPGIGKSRFMEESVKFFQRNSAETVCSKANEYEGTKTYTFVRRLVREVLSKCPEQGETETYKLLGYFLSEETVDAELKEKVEKLYTNPEEVAAAIMRLARGKNTVFAVFLDDLQWCDDQSAIIVAALIRCMNEDDKVFIELSARSDYQTMPLTVKHALSERKVEPLHLTHLEFLDEDGAPTELLREYVMESPPFDTAAETAVIPETFLRKLGEVSGGNPFAVTHILLDLVSRELLCIDDNGQIVIRERRIKFENYIGEALYANRITRLKKEEKEVCKIISVFGGAVSMKLFARLFPEWVQHAHLLEDRGLLATQPVMHFTHDLLWEAAKKKFPKNKYPELSWEIYTKVHVLSGNPEFREEITHTMQFGLVEPSLGALRESDASADPIYEAGKVHGIGAIKEMENGQRIIEADILATKILRLIPRDKMSESERFQCAFSLAVISLRLGKTEALLSCIGIAEDIAEHLPVNQRNWQQLLDLCVLRCDAMHLKRDSEGMGHAIEALVTQCGMVQEGTLGPDEFRKLRAAKYLIVLNQAREKYHRKDMQGALAECRELVGELEKLEQKDFTPPIIPLEYERVLLEARRFYVTIITQAEEYRRMMYDADTAFAQAPDAKRQGELKKALEAQRSVLDSYHSDRPLMRHPKDLISALKALAMLMVFTGMPKSDAMDVFHEASRVATNFQEVDLLTVVCQMRGDLCMSYGDTKTRRVRTQTAISHYKQGMAEISQLENGNKHPYYAYNACNAARALVIHIENFGGNNEETRDFIREGFRYACQALSIMSASKDTLPTLGRLLDLAEKYGIKEELQIPEDIRALKDADMRKAITELTRAKQHAESGHAEACVTDELAWKISGVTSLPKHLASI